METPNQADSGNNPIQRGEGVTPSEKYLKRLCDHSFLSLWSYPGIYRAQGGPRVGIGKEVCDLLVVFGNHIIIFSDKYYKFPDTGDLQVDWNRWFRGAVEGAAKQIYGAERWILDFPERLFLDRTCTQPFPINLPNRNTAKVHRIVVAHGASQRCKLQLGGSGSLMIASDIVGPQHYESHENGGNLFAVGQIDPNKGFVHIFDDTSLDIVLKTLDTITDFVEYLSKKELFLAENKYRVWAAGEEELLAKYLGNINEHGQHDFLFPNGYDFIGIDEGTWDQFSRSAQRQAQIRANKSSYAWDKLIEKFNFHLLNNTRYFSNDLPARDVEQALRFLARENRTRRRMLAKAFIEFIEKYPPSQAGYFVRASRVIAPSSEGDPYYIFLILQQLHQVPYDEYREGRRNLLNAYCHVLKLKFPVATDIVGIATETGIDIEERSEDLLYIDAREWSVAQQTEAEEVQKDLNLLQDMTILRGVEHEYPSLNTNIQDRLDNNPRNKPCPCGSGKKYKKCCLHKTS